MGKFIATVLLIADGFLLLSFAVVGYEGKVEAVVGNLWTSRRDPEDKPLQYLLVSNSGAMDHAYPYHRRHFGWPLWVLYVDVAANKGTANDGAWYAKLDVYKLAVNFAAACVPALAVTIVFHLFLLVRRRIRSHGS